jgi:uncharacterized FlaG/YvyC family protein
MQIPPFNAINLLSPLAEPPAIPPVAAVGAGMQAEGMQTNAQGQAPYWLSHQASEIKLSFPSERGADVEESLRTLAEAMQPANLELNFSRDDETGTIVIKLVDQITGEAVQQIPAEALLRLSASLGKLQGQLFDQQA